VQIETLPPEPAPKEGTILYLDDQPSHRLLFERSFRADWLILTAGSADEAREILKEHQVFLVVADHNMPGVSGIDFLQEVKSAHPATVRAILSAYADPSLKEEASRRAGIAAYLEKPWDRETIRRFLDEAYARYLFGVPTPATPERPDLESILQRGLSSPDRLASLFSRLERPVDERGFRRVILTYSEPPLKSFVAVVRRPTEEWIAKALQAAVSGNPREVEKILSAYFGQTVSEATEPPERNLH